MIAPLLPNKPRGVPHVDDLDGGALHLRSTIGITRARSIPLRKVKGTRIAPSGVKGQTKDHLLEASGTDLAMGVFKLESPFGVKAVEVASGVPEAFWLDFTVHRITVK